MNSVLIEAMSFMNFLECHGQPTAHGGCIATTLDDYTYMAQSMSR